MATGLRIHDYPLNGSEPHDVIVKTLRRLSFCLNWQSSILPRTKSALKCPDVFVAAFLKFLRQTGA
jgi:hypothetical protein